MKGRGVGRQRASRARRTVVASNGSRDSGES